MPRVALTVLQASDIVQIKSRKVLEPMIHIVLQRAAYVFERMFDISVNVLKTEPDSEYGMLGCYELFQNELRQVFRGFVRETEAKCKEKLKDDFDTFTKVIDWDLINGLQEMCVACVVRVSDLRRQRQRRLQRRQRRTSDAGHGGRRASPWRGRGRTQAGVCAGVAPVRRHPLLLRQVHQEQAQRLLP